MDILIYFHCESNTGYAILALESVFLAAARRITGDDRRIHFAYTTLDRGSPTVLAGTAVRVLAFDPATRDKKQLAAICHYVRANGIEAALGFDQPVDRLSLAALRAGGIKRIVSYWGAPMSSLNSGAVLAIKRLQLFLYPRRPDHFIFETVKMQETGILGRGLPSQTTSVIPLGVDTTLFSPDSSSTYSHAVFEIPLGRRIIAYSGHMEPRKGIAVIMAAARLLREQHKRDDFHFLLLGDQPGEKEAYLSLLSGSLASEHVTFAGYRQDIARIFPSCFCGVIASTGWESFTMSSLEMAACGLPLIVSRLQGLIEAIDDSRTGLLFPPGDAQALASSIIRLLDDSTLWQLFRENGRTRVVTYYSRQQQIERLTTTLDHVFHGADGALRS